MSAAIALTETEPETEHDPNDPTYWTREQVRAHHRAWCRRFVAEHPERNLVLLDTPHRVEITHRLPHLRAWRKRAGWAQWELSLRSGVQAGTISRLENGHTAARIGVVERLAAALGLDNGNLCERAPADTEIVVPTQRVQAIEPVPGDLRFYLHHLWFYAEAYDGGIAALATETGIPLDELRDLVEVEEPATLAEVERIARALKHPALELMAWD